MPCDSVRKGNVNLGKTDRARLLRVAEQQKWRVVQRPTGSLELWIDVSVKVVIDGDSAEVWRSRMIPGQKSNETYVGMIKQAYGEQAVRDLAAARGLAVEERIENGRKVLRVGKPRTQQTQQVVLAGGGAAPAVSGPKTFGGGRGFGGGSFGGR